MRLEQVQARVMEGARSIVVSVDRSLRLELETHSPHVELTLELILSY